MWIRQCKGKKEYVEEDWRSIWFKNETQWKNFTRGTDCLSRSFPFQHHQRQQNLHVLRFLSLQLSVSTSVLFPSLQHAFETTDFQGRPHCSFLILPLFPAHSEVCCLTLANMQQALMWNCTDLGQRLISLSLLTNPGLRVCVLLAGRHLWFNTTPPDMTPNQRQRLCDTVHLYFHLFILQQPINHTWTIRQQKRDGSKFRDY